MLDADRTGIDHLLTLDPINGPADDHQDHAGRLAPRRFKTLGRGANNQADRQQDEAEKGGDKFGYPYRTPGNSRLTAVMNIGWKMTSNTRHAANIPKIASPGLVQRKC